MSWDIVTASAMFSIKGQGEVTNAAFVAQLPSVNGRMAIIRAVASNTGAVYIGGAGTTAEDGTTDTTTGMELSAKDSITIPLGGGNLNNLYMISSVSGDGIVYLVLG